MHLKGLSCATCGAFFPPDGRVQDYCRTCGQRFGTLECILDLQAAAENFRLNPLENRPANSIVRYAPLLPASSIESYPPLRIGKTPMYEARRIADQLGLDAVYIKDDSLNPSGSYKDRASAMVTARAVELNYKVVACASTGNAAASLACCCAAGGIRCIVFVPESAPQAKLTQIAAFGAELIAVNGTYDEAFDLATQACEKYGWLNRSAGLSPYLVEGKKTGAFEICEDLNFDVPDAVFVGAGDGSIVTGICKGFDELHTMKWISSIPRVFAVQAEGASALAHAYQRYLKTGIVDIIPEHSETIADSISVGNPREGVRAIRSVHSTNGGIISVDDATIQHAIKDLAALQGVFSEPAGAAGMAGLMKAAQIGIVGKGNRVAVLVTGSGLKDIKGVGNSIRFNMKSIAPSMNELDHLIGG